jgi:hypothetical protein
LPLAAVKKQSVNTAFNRENLVFRKVVRNFLRRIYDTAKKYLSTNEQNRLFSRRHRKKLYPVFSAISGTLSVLGDSEAVSLGIEIPLHYSTSPGKDLGFFLDYVVE